MFGKHAEVVPLQPFPISYLKCGVDGSDFFFLLYLHISFVVILLFNKLNPY